MQQPPLPTNPAQPAGDGIPYLDGHPLRGFLFNIDTRQSTVALQSVRSFGTEGRRAEHVPPSPHVLQYATFKAAEIKDLHVCEAAPQPPQPPQPPASSAASSAASVTSGPPPPVAAPMPAPAAPKPTLLTPGSVSSAQKQQTQTQERTQTQTQTQRRSQTNNARTIPGADAAGVGPDDASGEFNFADGLNDFNKQQEFSKLEESAKTEPKGSYQKSSFFDTISCDALDRLEGQRKLNTETFGAVGLNNRRNFRGRGRGRRGGSRNGNWNGGRGGRGGRNSNNDFPRPQPAGP
ncbi:TFG box [Phytophthora cactorum]|nr:TFG box [Phytophthora cactorum]